MEVHLSDPARRESFRRVNFLEDAALARFVGMKAAGYHGALEEARRWAAGTLSLAVETGPTSPRTTPVVERDEPDVMLADAAANGDRTGSCSRSAPRADRRHLGHEIDFFLNERAQIASRSAG